VVCVFSRQTGNLKSIIFWDITPCSPLSVNRSFGGTYRFHLQGRKNKLTKKPAFTCRRWYFSNLLHIPITPDLLRQIRDITMNLASLFCNRDCYGNASSCPGRRKLSVRGRHKHVSNNCLYMYENDGVSCVCVRPVGEGRSVSECPLETLPSRGGVTSSSQTLLSSKRRPHFKTLTCLGENKGLGHGSRRDSKPRITVLARATSNLTNRPTCICM
jgi:hypothetical protein